MIAIGLSVVLYVTPLPPISPAQGSFNSVQHHSYRVCKDKKTKNDDDKGGKKANPSGDGNKGGAK
jgi:hypothetical protein